MEPRYVVHTVFREGVEFFLLEDGTRAAAASAPSLGNNLFLYSAGLPVLEPIAFADFLKKPTSFGIPLLFPFPNRLRDGAFTFQGKRYEVNPPRHGFVRDKAWRVIDTGASVSEGAWILSEIKAEDYPLEILSQFPFPFTLQTTYRLREAALEIHVVAENTGQGDMPVGFGIHPYFRRPGRGSVEVPARKRWELSDSLPTGTLLGVDGAFDLRQPRDIATLSLDDIYADAIPDEDGLVRCRLRDEVTGVQTVVEFSAAEFPDIVVYTPPAPRPAICIEPNSCPTDAFNLHERGVDAGVLVLKPGAKAEWNVRIFSEPL
ncbi:MAG: aldose 1-epimerase [Vicinamibacteria bacterium]